MIVALAAWMSVAIAYVVVFASIAALAVRSAQRGRHLARRVPEDQRRWM